MDEQIISGTERPDAFIADMQSGNDLTFQRIRASCQRAVEEDGAEFIILGCTCMSPIAARIAAQCAVPVINPFATAVKLAETMLKLGVAPGPRGVPAVRQSSLEIVRDMVAVASGDRPADTSAACPAASS